MRAIETLMTPDPMALHADRTVREALELLEMAHVRHLPVIEGGTVVGMLSDRDVRPWRQALWDMYKGEGTETARAALAQPISKLMRTDVLFLRPDAEVIEAIDTMIEFRIGAMPVLDGDQQLVGIVSYIDLLEWLRSLLGQS